MFNTLDITAKTPFPAGVLGNLTTSTHRQSTTQAAVGGCATESSAHRRSTISSPRQARTTGQCLVPWKCFVACRLGESSQQPTCPQVRHRRRCTQPEPMARHSSQPSAPGVTSRIVCRWLHPRTIPISPIRAIASLQRHNADVATRTWRAAPRADAQRRSRAGHHC